MNNWNSMLSSEIPKVAGSKWRVRISVAAALYLHAAVPLDAIAQDAAKPPAAQAGAATDKSKKGAAAELQKSKGQTRGATTITSDPKKPETRVVPLNGGQAAPAGQGAIKVQSGPDGKPQVIGPDGKPITPGTDGQAVIGAPTGGDGGPGGGRSFGFGRRGGGDGFPPGGTISMDFRGSDINNVLKFFAMATGWQIVPDATLSGPVTIISPKQLTIDQAFQVLQSVLQIRGFSGQLEKKGKTDVLTIVPFDRATGSATTVIGPKYDPDTGRRLPNVANGDLKNMVITEVIPIENVDASALSRELTSLINKGASLVASAGTNALIVTDTASNVERIRALVEMLDKAASNSEIRKFALHHSDATDIANAINSLFGRVFNRGAGGGGQGGGGGGGGFGGGGGGGPAAFQANPGGGGAFQIPGQPGGAPGQPGGGGQGGGARAAIVAVADTRTNSVLVVASRENMARVKDLIDDLDDPGATALENYTRKMKYADAVDVADTINSILSGTQPGRSGQQGNNFGARVFGGGGFGGGGFGGGGFGGGGQQAGMVQSTDPFAKVVANARTNTLYIMATKERMDRIDDMIKDLDVPVAVESTTFVIPLKNVQAQDLATTLSQAFGTQTGTGGNGFNNFGGGFSLFGNNNNRNPNQRQTIQRRTGTGSGTGGRAAQINTGPGNAQAPGQDAAISGVMTPNGFIPDPQQDTATSRQFFFPGGGGGGFGGFGRQGQQQTPLYGRGQTGSFVNLLQLRQNVGVVPDLNSNSLIVTTTPDNLKAIQQIVDSLDIVPRQVMIEVIIAEATLDSTQKLGFQFDAKGVGKFLGDAITQAGAANFPLGNAGTAGGNISSPISPGAQYGVQAVSGKFNGLVQALATDNKVRILATPKIFTSNNQQAQIDVTTNIPIVQAQPQFGGTTQNSYTSLAVGITVNVTPRITKDGLVTMDVVASDTELLGFDTLQTGSDSNGNPTFLSAPRTSERSTDTSVSVRDNEIIALGGLMRDSKTLNVNKIPLLGDIPIIGHLFRSTSTETVKTELMLFLIPHVVDGDAQARALAQEEAKKLNKIMPELPKTYPLLDPKNNIPLPDISKRGQLKVDPKSEPIKKP